MTSPYMTRGTRHADMLAGRTRRRAERAEENAFYERHSGSGRQLLRRIAMLGLGAAR